MSHANISGEARCPHQRQISATIINETLEYLQQFLEHPNPAFGGLQICPFFRRARLNNQIQFYVHPFSLADLDVSSELLMAIESFGRDRLHQVFFCIHPDKKQPTFAEVTGFVENLNPLIQPLNLVAFGGHPDDPFNVRGVHTRVTPYVNFTVQFQDELNQASRALQRTQYYSQWSPENLAYIGFPRN